MAGRRTTNSGVPKLIETLRHDEARRTNIPTAEYQSLMEDAGQYDARVRYPRNTDMDPQLVWRGKDEQDWSDLVVQAPPLYIQEKVHPKVLIDDLVRESKRGAPVEGSMQDMFADFNGIPEGADRTEFYLHDQNWTNRMILGDSLQVMASLAEREGLRGKVQCIYLDPPYGIKFNSNFQWSTDSRDVTDGKREHISREPEQVKAFRDTWKDGIHSYLTYLRDRLTVARDLLTESGSIVMQIGDENVHRIRALMDEVFGPENCISVIPFIKTTSQTSDYLPNVADYIVWYARNLSTIKFRHLYSLKSLRGEGSSGYTRLQLDNFTRRAMSAEERKNSDSHPSGAKVFSLDNLTSQRPPGDFPVRLEGRTIRPNRGYWKTGELGMSRLQRARRVDLVGNTPRYVRFIDDFPVFPLSNVWTDTVTAGFASDKVYVVQTLEKIVERCILMATDPGDLVLDPTCGSGTTATVAELWGRRWITIDTSRVALALARARIMGARYPYYILTDSPEGVRKEAEVTRSAPSSRQTHGDIRHGFVYERVPHITLKSIANNAEIDVIWEEYEARLAQIREEWSVASGQSRTFEEWEIPREADPNWPPSTHSLLTRFWEARIARQKAIDASIAAKAESEYLYDRPFQENKRVRVAGPFTVESLSPYRVLGVDENDHLIDSGAGIRDDQVVERDFTRMILDNLLVAGVQQTHREDRIAFESLVEWPGEYVCAEGTYREGESGPLKRAAVFIGPEFGTVGRADLVAATREAADASFDVLISCAFAYDAHSTEFDRIGRVPVLKARMNADLHMAGELKETSKGNLFVIFGEPDINLLDDSDGRIRVKINGVDVFDPSSGKIRSDGADGIACWFIDTDYNEESFFVRHAYFLGQNDPYKSLKTTLKAEIDEDAWASLNSDVSRPFERPAGGRIAVKVINHLGDEVMKVFRV